MQGFNQAPRVWLLLGYGQRDPLARVRGLEDSIVSGVLPPASSLAGKPASWALSLYSCTGPHAQKDSTLGLTACCCHLGIWTNFLTRGLRFHIALGPANCITSSAFRVNVAGTMFLSQRHHSCLRPVSYNHTCWVPATARPRALAVLAVPAVAGPGALHIPCSFFSVIPTF